MSSGLSPRPRGSQYTILAVLAGLGSIPASAGKPITALLSTKLTGVYPRVRGEALMSTEDMDVAWGLSPRPRGSPFRRFHL